MTLSPSFFLPFETNHDRAGPAVFSRQRRFQPRFSGPSGRKGQRARGGKGLLIKALLLCSTVLVWGSLLQHSLPKRRASAPTAPQPFPAHESRELLIDQLHSSEIVLYSLNVKMPRRKGFFSLKLDKGTYKDQMSLPQCRRNYSKHIRCPSIISRVTLYISMV